MLRYKYSLANCNKLDNMNSLDLLNIEGLDESILVGGNIFDVTYSSASGEDGDEDSVEHENEEAEVGGVESADLPRFRSLVREKKLSMKAQYGKGHYVVTETWRNSPSVGSAVSVFVAFAHPKKTKWQSGWRKQWKNFKQQGGLAQLKQQAKGLAPIPTPTPIPSTITPTTGLPKKRLSVIPSGLEAIKAPDSKGKLSDSEPTTDDSGTTTGRMKAPETPITDDKILGMPKTVFYIGLGVVALVGGIIVYKKFIAKK
jgi:hypothetical protein